MTFQTLIYLERDCAVKPGRIFCCARSGASLNFCSGGQAVQHPLKPLALPPCQKCRKRDYTAVEKPTRSKSVFWSEGHVSQRQRCERNGHKGCIVWLTGLPSSGKSTLSWGLERELFARGFQAIVLDGDNLRHGLNSDLGFSPEDRTENIRRAAQVGLLLAMAGQIAIIGLISPYRQDRRGAREIARAVGCEFIEVYVDAPLRVCEERDPKHLYRRARAGEVRGMTGIDAPYEEPEHAEIHVRTSEWNVEECLTVIMNSLTHVLAPSSPGTVSSTH